MEEVQSMGIGVGVHFRAVHLHPYYRETYGFTPGQFPVSEGASRSVVSLPLCPSLSEGEQDRVVEACRKVLEG
jgi:dTDP-4-amino-4,6-dideoxygalactose transaminase